MSWNSQRICKGRKELVYKTRTKTRQSEINLSKYHSKSKIVRNIIFSI